MLRMSSIGMRRTSLIEWPAWLKLLVIQDRTSVFPKAFIELSPLVLVSCCDMILRNSPGVITVLAAVMAGLMLLYVTISLGPTLLR